MSTLLIARFTLAEARRRRLLLAAVVVSAAFLGLFVAGFSFLYGQAREVETFDPTASAVAASVLTVLGLYAVYLLAGLLALFMSVGAVSSEVDTGTLHAVLARPVTRAQYVTGRWLAFGALVTVYVAVMAGALMATARIVAGYTPLNPWPVLGLMALQALALLTLSLFGSTILSTLANGVVVFSLFGLAWLAGIIEFVGRAVANTAMVNLGIVVSLAVPSDAIWRGASYYASSPALLAAGDFIGLPFASSAPPAGPLVAWALAYPLLFLGLAVVAFRRRDL